MRISKPGLRASVAAVGLLLASLPLGLAASPSPAASTGSCNTASTRNLGLSAYPHDYGKIPLNSSSWDCWMGKGHGTTAGQKRAVKAVQNNILTCYSGTTAAARIRNSGGADGVYGDGMVSAIKAFQRYQLGFTGSAIDGVYGVKTRKGMRWAHHASDGVILVYPNGYLCTNPNRF
ncbi:peptidoglycan-binding domain-containing protein [Nocardioides sp. NPDC059952]|uniref:peptidoglycan-binding domain-containing protein n=1 Tax=Nocardioides sp. NPDC059952 TaxID=3347014 RepID=UPI00364ACAF5